jgi:sec-independent protein translocase protein TatA
MMFFDTLALGFGPLEMTLIAAVGLLLFGKRLPEVGKGLAGGIMSFKKGLKEVEQDIDQAANNNNNKTPPASGSGGSSN